ncbi:MAG: hypothetical protein AAGH92_01165 [Planctomycetota bacterium]
MTRTNPSKTRIARMTGLTLVAGLIAGPACAVSVPYFQDFESFPGSPDPDLRIENEGGIGSGDNAFGWILFPDVANPLDDPANPDDDLNNAYGLFLQSPDETLFNSGSLEIDVADSLGQDFRVATKAFSNAGIFGTNIEFTAGNFGVSANGAADGFIVDPADEGTFPAVTSGYSFFVSNFIDGENVYQLNLSNGGNVVASSPTFALTEAFNVATVTLELVGEYQSNGDLELTGTLTDLDFGAVDQSQTLSATLPAAELAQAGDTFGAFGAQGFFGNGFSVLFDDLEVDLLVAAGLAGDFDGGGSVEQSDLNLVLNNWGSDRTFEDGLTEFSTVNVDQEELNAVLNNWGSSSAPVFTGNAVPEPATIGLLSAIVLFGQRRRTA